MSDQMNAFPACEEANQNQTMGMTLRDYFAGQALAGNLDGGVSAENEASFAYKVADAMMKAREEKAE